jgi:HlyD family secretion protein/macrolide-specific efflux system membrane fusion protein
MSVPQRRRRWWPWIVGGLLLLAAGTGGWIYHSSGDTKELDSALIVEVKRGDFPIDVVETGKVEPREKVELKSKVAGQVEKVFVTEGVAVTKGELLVQIEPTDYRRDVARCDADVAQAKNALEFAQLSLQRKQRGFAERGVAQADVDFAENDVKSKQVAVTTAQVALSAAQDRLRYTSLVATLNGTVIERGIEPGEMVIPGSQATMEGKALLTVADLSTLIVKTDLNQIDVAKVKLGQTVTLTLDALPGKTYTATVTKVAPASITPKGKDVDVFPVEATLKEADGLIKPGMSADVRIHIETKKVTMSLPIEAVTKEAGKSHVTRILSSAGKQKTDKVEVVTGVRNDRDVELVSGLAAGDKVLIKPASSADNEFK